MAAVCEGHTMAQCALGHSRQLCIWAVLDMLLCIWAMLDRGTRQLCIWLVLDSCVCGLFVPPTAELESSKRELQKHQEELQRRIEHKFTGTLAGQLRVVSSV